MRHSNTKLSIKQVIKYLQLLYFLIFGSFSANAQNYVYSSKLGSEALGAAQFAVPQGINHDKQGNIYVVDQHNHRVRKLDPEGNPISMFGIRGTGDGFLEYPRGIAVDDGGNVYVTDQSRVQKFDAQGNFIFKFGVWGTGDGQLLNPDGIHIDSDGYIYVADGHKVQKFDAQGNFIRKFGSDGTGEGQFQGPLDVTLDAIGNVFVADVINNNVQKFDAQGNFLQRIGVSSTGVGLLNYAQSVSVDDVGNIYVAVVERHQIQKFNAAGELVMVIGNGTSGPANNQFYYPRSLTVTGDGRIYIADTNNHRVQVFSLDGSFIKSIGSLGHTQPGMLYLPYGVSIDNHGSLFVADYQRVQKFVDGTGTNWKQFYSRATAFDASGNIFVATYISNEHSVYKYTSNGDFILKFGSLGYADGMFNYITGMAIDGTGNLYVVDRVGVQKYDLNGNFLQRIGASGAGDGQFNTPYDIAVDVQNNIYITDTGNRRVQVFDSQGNFLYKFGAMGTGDGQFQRPTGIAVDKQGKIIIADSFNNRVQVFNSQGNFITKFGSSGIHDGQFQGAADLVVDADGKIYVVDTNNHRVQIFETEISTQNLAPVLAAIGYKSVDQLATLSFQASATDDGLPNNTLTYSLVAAESGTYPSGASITSSGTFNWTPTEVQEAGFYRLKVMVSDGALTDEEEIQIQINEVNSAPVLAEIGNKTVVVDANLSFIISATDNDDISYSTSSLPAGATFDNAARTFSWTPTGKQMGEYSITFRVTDGVLSDEEIVHITVAKPADLMPVITGFSPAEGPVGTWVTVSGTNLRTTTLVTFNGQDANSVVIDDNTVRAMVPQGALSGKIGVTTAYGSANSNDKFIVKSLYGSPVITSFSPRSGPVGTIVTISGTGFGNTLDNTTSITFNGQKAREIISYTNTQIRLKVPAGAKTGKIQVTNIGGTAISSHDFTVTKGLFNSATSSLQSTDTGLVSYPNPFSDKITVAFRLDQKESYLLEVYDMRGALITKVDIGVAEAGKLYEYEFDARTLTEGVYIARLVTSSKVQSLKMVLKR